MVEINGGKTRAAEIMERNRKISRSESLMAKNMALSGIPEISNRMARSVSSERREIMEMQLEAGEFREQGSSGFSSRSGDRNEIKNVQTQMGVIAHSGKGLYKMATDVGSLSSSSGGNWRGSNDTVRQAPEVYSPLWLNSNLNLPRDRPTINAWSRSFFALNPIVHNAITLHSTYPIAKLNIKSKNPKVERFFSQMSEEIDLMNVAVMAAQEYWILGEAFIYGELDESKGSWSRLMILNPDYVNVQRSVIAAEPIISLRPDENLRRVVFGNQPSDLQQRKQLDPSIIEHVRRNEQIPLNNFYVHHMARRISPYEIRGTGLIVSCFRALMCFDKLRECYSTQHEVLTNEGFKRIEELVEISTDVTPKSEYVNGVEVDESGNVTGVLKLKDGIKVACFNPDTEELEYHVPEEFHMSKYTGKMLHFHGNKVDAQVTPNHKMWVRQQSTKKTGPRFGDWYKLPAKEMLDKKTWWKFRGQAKWTGNKIDTTNVCGHEVATDIYLKFLGYVVSEGCVYRNNQNDRYDEIVQLTQLVGGKYFDDIREVSEKFANCLDKKASDKRWVSGSGYSAHAPKEKWETRIHGKDIVQYFFDEIGDGQSANSHNKHLPRWVMELCPEQLQILLDALNAGDGSIKTSKHGTNSKGMSYTTVSKQLADDVYELVFKCGFAPNMCVSKRVFEEENREVTQYIVLWSTTNYGNEPNVYTGKRQNHGNGGGATVDEIDYDGMVWCFTVPTGLFVTRCNNKISIQGNSKFAQADGMINPLTLVKIGNGEFRPSPVDLEHWRNVFENAAFDKDFKIFTHDAVNVERVGYGQGIYDTSADITQLIKEIYIGLMVPSVIMDGSDTTYATGSVALDVLRQRYMQFRQMMTTWLKRKIFAPIAQINDFYERVDGEKILIVPEIDWNHMSLFDMDSYINQMVNLTQGEGVAKRASLQTLYRSLGLEYEEEQRKIRYEDIQDAIRTRELQALAKYDLHELKALGPGDEIDEAADEPVPGESPYVTPQNTGALPGSPGGLGGGLGAPPGPGPMPGAPPPAPMGGGGAKPPGL
jgi:hypothetical protein